MPALGTAIRSSPMPSSARWRTAAARPRAPAGCRSMRCCARKTGRWWRWRRCMPRAHSYGEYVFDHGWAHALERAGGDYYPKLQVAAPFSPVPGPRLLRHPDAGVPVGALADALQQALPISWTCPRCMPRSAPKRNGRRWARPAGCGASACSSTGRTPAMQSFDDFLAALSSRKRKAIRRERRDAHAAGLTFHALSGGGHHRAALGRLLPLLSLHGRTANGAPPT